MINWSTASALVLCVPLLANSAHSQEVPITSLSQTDQVCERGFTNLVGIKELKDGRVILVDKLERLVLLLDADLTDGRPIGRDGAGPGEYRVPSLFFSLAGDSSVVLDTSNRRLLVLGPDGEPGGFLRFSTAAGGSKLRATDDGGGFYFAWDGVIQRWSPSSSVLDTVAVYPVWHSGQTNPADDNPFQAMARWAVAADGRIAIVHPDPYLVEMINADGLGRKGPPISFDPIEVSEEHKADWRKRMTLPRLGLPWEPTRWPKDLPAFLPHNLRDALTFAPDGRLWVQRTTPVGDPPTFDVFDSEGVCVEQVKLPRGRRLLGFCRGTVYAVVRDELDLEYLERYSLLRH